MTSGDVRLRVGGAILAFVTVLSPLCARAQAGVDESKEMRGGLEAMRKGHYEQAAERFGRAIEQAPTSPDARLGLAWAYLKQRKFLQSVEQLLVT